MKGSAILLLLCVATLISAPGHAQVRAVNFNGFTRLYNPGSLGGPASSKSLACSFWYRTTLPQSAVIVDSSGYLAVAMMIAFTPNIQTSRPHLAVVTGDLSGNNQWSLVGLSPLPTDQYWHHVAFTLTTVSALATYALDGHSESFDPDLGHFGGFPGYNIPVSGNGWTIGASTGPRPILPPLMYDGFFVGTSVGHYDGDLAELTCHFGDADYMEILNPGRQNAGYTEQIINALGQRVFFGPLELGEFCAAVFADYSPLCMRGDALHFRLNNGGSTAFTTIEGGLTDATSDPFSLWR